MNLVVSIISTDKLCVYSKPEATAHSNHNNISMNSVRKIQVTKAEEKMFKMRHRQTEKSNSLVQVRTKSITNR